MKDFDKKLSFKLVNISLIFVIIYLFGKTMFIWLPILTTVKNILIPFIIAFALAYALYPVVVKLQNKGMRKSLAVFFVLFLLFTFIGFLIYLLIPVLIEQLSALFNWVSSMLPDISNKYGINLDLIQEYIGKFNTNLGDISKSLGDISISVLNQTINLLTISLISLILFIKLLIDMDKIREKIKKYLSRKSKKLFNYVKSLDYEMSQYFIGLGKFILVQFVEYTLVFLLIGHPYYLLFGVLCAVTTIIPYFGGIFANIIACITSFFISQKLFILTLIIAFVCPNIDGYIISPKIYGKTNKVPTLLTILAVYAGGKVYGVVGIIIALPMTILLLATYRFYEKDINKKLEELKSV